MSLKLKKCSVLIIAAVLLVAVLCVGAASAAVDVKVWNVTSGSLQSLTDVEQSVSGTTGYAKLIAKTDDTYTLELSDFTVGSPASPVSSTIIKSSAPNLVIKLVGESNLTGNFADGTRTGLVYSSGNLTITDGGNSNGKLLVNNTVTAKSVCAINALGNITIDSVIQLTANATTTAEAYAYAIASGIGEGKEVLPQNLVITSSNVFANANSAEGSGDGYYASSLYAIDNITISDKSVVTVVTDTADDADIYAIDAEDSLEISGSTVKATANSPNGYYVEALYAANNITISDHSDVTVVANSTDSASAYAIETSDGNLEIKEASTVKAIANTTNGTYAYALYPCYDVIISGNSDVTATAESTGNASAYAIDAYEGDIEIDASAVKAIANTANGTCAKALYSYYDIIISGNSDVTATAEATDNKRAYAYAIETYDGNLEIKEASTVKAIANTTSGDYAAALYAQYNLTISENSDVTATAEATGNEYADVYAIKAYEDIEITGSETEVIGKAISSKLAITLFAGNNLTINSAKRITAIGRALPGQATSFGYNYSDPGTGKLNIDGLADYTFSNATYSGEEPKTYATFANPNNWHFDDDEELYVSNYTAVTIEKKSTPTPSPSYSSSSHQTGYTQILQEVPTTTPTPTPTPTAVPTAVPTPVVNPTAKPTTQPTQSSPAPLAGLLAGLGAAALVLTRMRR